MKFALYTFEEGKHNIITEIYLEANKSNSIINSVKENGYKLKGLPYKYKRDFEDKIIEGKDTLTRKCLVIIPINEKA